VTKEYERGQTAAKHPMTPDMGVCCANSQQANGSLHPTNQQRGCDYQQSISMRPTRANMPHMYSYVHST
jgi:hypothetical protein